MHYVCPQPRAFLNYSRTCRVTNNKKLVHVTRFPCHQQCSANECAFYTAHHMTEALGLLDVNEHEKFEVVTTSLAEHELDQTQENIASFIICQVIDKKGKFHCQNPGVAVC